MSGLAPATRSNDQVIGRNSGTNGGVPSRTPAVSGLCTRLRSRSQSRAGMIFAEEQSP